MIGRAIISIALALAEAQEVAGALLECDHPLEHERRFQKGGGATWCGVCGRLVENQRTMFGAELVHELIAKLAAECSNKKTSDERAIEAGHSPIGECKWILGSVFCQTHGGAFVHAAPRDVEVDADAEQITRLFFHMQPRRSDDEDLKTFGHVAMRLFDWTEERTQSAFTRALERGLIAKGAAS